MSYAQISDLKERLGASFDAVYDALEEAAPGNDLESACAEIDCALACRYAMPVQGTRSAALLKDWNLTLAEERAYARCAGNTFADKVRLRVEQVRKYLELIRTDRFRLPDAQEKSGTGAGISFLRNEKPVFTRDTMKKF